MKLYVTGGRQRKQILGKRSPEWNLYEKALIIELDIETQQSKICVEYESPPDSRPDKVYSILFKHGTLQGNKLYVCTSTEVLVYEVPAFRHVGYVSLPCFNDLHHVCPTANGTLLVASTGLDMVIEFTPAGKVLRQWNVLGGDPWGRFSEAVDYRKVSTTKPHKSHPNFVFQIGQEIWVTRAWQRDALCLTDSDKRIEIGLQTVHDGLVLGNSVYFTLVDGRVVVVDQRRLRVVEVIDLTTMDNEGRTVLGWCRGLMTIDENRMWVGFTRVRKTKWRENVLWIKQGFREVDKPTHIALYDVASKKRIREIDLEKHGMNIVFSMFRADPSGNVN